MRATSTLGPTIIALIAACVAAGVLMGGFASTEAPSPSASPSSAPVAAAGGRFKQRIVASRLQLPVDAAPLPDGSLLVATQRGKIYRVFESGEVREIGDLSNRVFAGGERGMLGIALAADFSLEGVRTLYLSFNRSGDGDTVLVRAELDATTLDIATVSDPLVEIAHFNQNHNGGDIVAIDDRTLLLSTGDSGGSGDPKGAAQDPTSYLGKILRIQIGDGAPIVSIAAKGLRNPWRVTFDAQSGELWIADVGQDTVEEVNRWNIGTSATANFGWPIFEGNRCFREDPCTAPATYLPPIATYRHSDGGCAVIGGAIFDGHYMFGDFCDRRIYALPLDARVGSTPSIVAELELGGRLVALTGDGKDRIWLLDDAGNVSLLDPM